MKKALNLITIIGIITSVLSSCSKGLEPINDDEPDNISNSSSEIIVYNNIHNLSEEQIKNVTKLTVKGTISGEDWNIIFEMAVLGKLEYLDMSDAKIAGNQTAPFYNDDEIPEYQFNSSKTLKEVILPKSLKTIGKEAFANCAKLSRVSFPESIDSIGARAFYKTALSGEFIMPSKIRVIGKQAFGSTKISKVIISNDIDAAKDNNVYTLYGNSVFSDCTELKEVVMLEGCTKLELGFTHCISLNKVTLPNTLQQIGRNSGTTHNYIFSDCKELQNITLPANLVYIGESAFNNTALEQVTLPNSVRTLSSFAFSRCANLKEITLSSELKEIGTSCFKNCTALTHINIPDKVDKIETDAFSYCDNLQEVKMGNNIREIAKHAFYNCTSLKSIILSKNLQTLGTSAFEGCSVLETVMLSDNIHTLEPTTFKNCISLKNLKLGTSIETIGSSCFFHCPKLDVIIIPQSVTNIESLAFAYSGINHFKVLWSSPLNIKEDVFKMVNLNKATLTVPIGTSSIYQNSPIWKDFGFIVEEQ